MSATAIGEEAPPRSATQDTNDTDEETSTSALESERMGIFEQMNEKDHEQVAFWSEPTLGYRGIIAIHDTTLGPALGGTRFWNYESEEDALTDVLRLSRGMTYKAAITGLNLGGGKSVIMGDNRTTEREMLFRAHGRAVQALGGRYITAEDVGTSVEDMEFVRMETDYVTGVLGGSGDPSPVTAHGVFMGVKAAAKKRYGDDSLEGRHVAVQGVGHVGYYLCRYLTEDGAELTVTDLDLEKVATVREEFGARAVEPEKIYAVDADIFAPCALGAVVNDDTLDVFSFDIIAGGANNQLAQARHGQALEDRGILYAPDYVINAGGICNVYGELYDWTAERSKRKAGEIYHTLLRVFARAEEEGIPTSEAADRLAEQRIAQTRELKRTYL